MEAPRCSVIIPAPDEETARAAGRRLAESLEDDDHFFEFLLVVGRSPSAQRNLAIRSSEAEFVLFLDSDVTVRGEFWGRIRKEVERGLVDIVGGPVLLPSEATTNERIFQDALSHPLVVGNAAARYSRIGERRRCTESELILSNLLVRRSLFEEFGEFNEALYPNEENEWLDRLPPRVRVFHDPELFVDRPQRATWSEFVRTLYRYGEGRTHQALVSGKWHAKNLPPVLALALVACAIWKPKPYFLIGSVVGVGLLGVLATSTPARNSGRPLLVSVADGLLFKSYTLGQLAGLGRLLPRRNPHHPLMLYRYDFRTEAAS